MRLNGRVAKLENKIGGASTTEHPSVIFITSVWREDDGEILSEPLSARVRIPAGWDYVQREEGESGEDFENRVEQVTLA